MKYIARIELSEAKGMPRSDLEQGRQAIERNSVIFNAFRSINFNAEKNISW